MLLLAAAPRLQVGQKTLELPATDALLLAWLALNGATPRERLAGLLWPDSEPQAARNAMRQRLFRLRKLAGRELVEGNTSLTLAAGITHDLDAAASLLEGLPTLPEGEIGRWLHEQSERLRQSERERQAGRIAALEAAGEVAEALALAAVLLQAEPLSEEAHRRVIRLHYLNGDRAAALLAFDRCAATLKDEVGTRPGAETMALLDLLQADDAAAGAAAELPRPRSLPPALLRPPRLIGREAELAELRQGWQSAAPLLVIGEAGIGKSRLLQALAAPDPTLITAAGRPGDNLVPYASLARLLGNVIERLGPALAAPLRRALAPLVPTLAEPGLAQRSAGLSRGMSLLPPVQALLQQAAPLVGGLLLDDLHFADAASVELLGSLLTLPRGHAAATRWCLGLRPPLPETPLATLVAGLQRAGPCTRVVVQPLAVSAIAELLQSLHLPGVAPDAPARWAPVLRQRSGGNPLFVLETLKLAWSQGLLEGLPGAGEALPRSASLQQLIGEQLGRLGADALALARLAAVAGIDFSLPLAEQVLGRHALALADPWHELEQQQVFVGSEFAHDLVYEAVLVGVPAPIARHLHAQVARWLEARAAQATHDAAAPADGAPPPDPARIAAHWERAGDAARALPHLRAAAERAHVALREHERIQFLMRAADIAEQRGDRTAAFDAIAQAVQSHMNTIRHAEGYPLLDRLDALAASDDQRALALGHRAWYCVQLADTAGALQHGAAALALAETLAEPQPAIVIRHRLAAALAGGGRFDEALAHFEHSAAAIVRLHDDGHREGMADADLAEFHGNHAAVLDNLGHFDAAATQRRLALAAAVRAGDAAQQVSQLANQAVGLHAAGRYVEMLDVIEQAQRLIARYEMDGSTVGFVAVLQCQGARALGRFADALAAADRAEALLAASNPARLPVVLLQRGHCWLDLGQLARAQRSLIDAGEALPPHLQARRCLLLARALPREAAAWRERAAAALPREGWPEIRLLVRLQACAAGDDPALMLAQLDALHEEAATLGLHGVRRAVLARGFELQLTGAVLSPARAEMLLTDAAALLSEPIPGDATAAALSYLGELPWLAARLLHARGRSEEARALHQRLRRWLEHNLATQVEAPFRAGHREAQPVNRELLAGLDRSG